MKDINKKTKTKLLLSFLENVPFDGWSWETLYFSAVDTGLIKSKKLSQIEKAVAFEISQSEFLQAIKAFLLSILCIFPISMSFSKPL